MDTQPGPPPRDPGDPPKKRRPLLWRLTVGTVGTCLRYRVTGLAAEAGFFALLSLPPLVLGLVGSLGYFVQILGQDTIDSVRNAIVDAAEAVLSASSVQEVIVPTLDDVLKGGRFDVISVGFLLSLWSGSRALNVYVDTITIMYGMGGRRGIVRTRALSFSLYAAGLVIGAVLLPLVLAGPELVADALPRSLDVLNLLYWPIVVLLSVVFLTTLYHVSLPERRPWRHGTPGAALALVIWILGSFVLRAGLRASVGGTSIYGPLAAPIAVLLWLYLTAIAVLIGAALNAEVAKVLAARTGLAEDSGEQAAAERVKEQERIRTHEIAVLASRPVTPGTGAPSDDELARRRRDRLRHRSGRSGARVAPTADGPPVPEKPVTSGTPES